MLKLKQIVKDYKIGDTTVHALRGVDIEFRRSEFVAILGQSGCGKTTLLNIIGGLDQYTQGDLIINGRSTRDYGDGDWDLYRNRSIGFVFQSYNLIPHQSVLSNVELAMTLSGVSKNERRRRAIEALEKVGLGDQTKKKPNQLSGGQMQRVAIARALVNDPDILLADEPTGAIDSETSVQIMDILKDIASDRLVVMVTHNPDLAQNYATRIIRLLDGNVISDTRPYAPNIVEPLHKKGREKKTKKPSMSFFTALSLSMNNLMTKKARTFLTAFAGSIGIIGIALILSISTGLNDYIDRMQEDTLSSYPLTIETTSMDITSLMTSFSGTAETDVEHDLDRVYSNSIMSSMMDMMVAEITTNNLVEFKEYIDSGESGLEELTNDIKFGYSTDLNIYSADTSNGIVQVNPSTLLSSMGMSAMAEASSSGLMSSMSNTDVWEELIGNEDILSLQYDVIAGRMPETMDEVVLFVDENNEIYDYSLYALGLLDSTELEDFMTSVMGGDEDVSLESGQVSYSYDELLDLYFKLVPTTDYYLKNDDGEWIDMSGDEDYMTSVIEDALDIKVVGILRPNEDAVASSVTGSVGYLGELMEYLIDEVANSEIVQEQKAKPDIDVFTGIEFNTGDEENTEPLTMEGLSAYIATLPEEEQIQSQGYIAQMQEAGMGEEEILAAFAEQMGGETTTATYEGNLTLLGVSDPESPSSIYIYSKDFDAKEKVIDVISDYNKKMEDEGRVEDSIQYTDIVGLMMSSVSTIINGVSYILIAFVSISLVVSSIMIGIITYISVLERTKEIGILRSIGASKKDISNVFNAETLFVGFVAGVIGIAATLLLSIPINIIIKNLVDISNIATLPAAAAVILVAISMLLTFVAGLIPSSMAARKDPVEALRTE